MPPQCPLWYKGGYDYAAQPARQRAGRPCRLMHEQTFNEVLAVALRQRRRLWRGDPNSVLAERRRVLADVVLEGPDILVVAPDIYNVIIEVEFDGPAFDDARRKPGLLVVGATGRARYEWSDGGFRWRGWVALFGGGG